MLFFAVPFSFMVQDLQWLVERQMNSDVPMLFRGSMTVFPSLLALVIPTVVALLIFNTVHSQKQGLFVHGLPVKRSTNYISTLLAGFTLMAVPIILNGFILLIMSFGKYDAIFSSRSVLLWMLIQLGVIFIMYSVSVFSAFLTGNTAVHIGINIFIHILPLLVALTIFTVSDVFLFGFTQSRDFIAERILNNNPVIWLFSNTVDAGYNGINIFKKLNMWIYMAGAVVFYILGYLLYKVRKIEANGDVAAFKVFRPILKYSVTTAVAIVTFSATYNNLQPIFICITVIIITAIVYFACQMLLNKSFKVFKFYKGYLIFLLCCGLFVSFFAFTNVFGYETRIPDKNEIESAAVHNSYNEDLFVVNDENVIDATRLIHKKSIINIPVVTDNFYKEERNSYYNITYKLKNGNIIERRYRVTKEEFDFAMSLMYNSLEYKLKATELDNLNIENVNFMDVVLHNGNFSFSHYENNMANEIINAVKKDVDTLSYEEITAPHWLNFEISISCTAKENMSLDLFKTKLTGENDEYMMQNFRISINKNFKNTFKVLEETGCIGNFKEKASSCVYILKEPVETKETEQVDYSAKDYTYVEERLDKSKFVKLDYNDALKVLDIMLNNKSTDVTGENYHIYMCENFNDVNIFANGFSFAFPKDELPDFLLSYIN
jgi:ABC-2 type transport system permease protein